MIRIGWQQGILAHQVKSALFDGLRCGKINREAVQLAFGGIYLRNSSKNEVRARAFDFHPVLSGAAGFFEQGISDDDESQLVVNEVAGDRVTPLGLIRASNVMHSSWYTSESIASAMANEASQ